jgi:hypothetical protein
MKITMRELTEIASPTEIELLFNNYGVFTVVNDNSIIIAEITSQEEWIAFLSSRKLIKINPSNE